MTTPMLTCDDAQALIPDLLDGTLSDTLRARFDAHAGSCAECRSLTGDLTAIRDDAAALPGFSPSRDLWSGIEARIATPVVSMPERPRRAIGWTSRQVAAAGLLLMSVSVGGTWMAVSRSQGVATLPMRATAPVVRVELVSVADQKGIATYESEIAKLRDVLTTRRGELDSATVAVLEKNLRLIDDAIVESKTALMADPASAFLAGRLNLAYGNKLDLLRAAATMPSRS